MQAELTYLETCHCTWCEKENEGVQAAFSSGFLTMGTHLCFKCLHQALRVDHKQSSDKKSSNRGAKDQQ